MTNLGYEFQEGKGIYDYNFFFKCLDVSGVVSGVCGCSHHIPFPSPYRVSVTQFLARTIAMFVTSSVVGHKYYLKCHGWA